MPGRPARIKGARAERELVRLLIARGFSVRRRLGQSRDGGCDLEGFQAGPHAFNVEVKRQEHLNIPAWWRQAVASAKRGEIPLLAWRRSREPWMVALTLDDLVGLLDRPDDDPVRTPNDGPWAA